MKKFKLMIILIYLLVRPVCCTLRRKKDDTIKTFNKETGEAIVNDNLIQKFEKEHQIFYSEEVQRGVYLEWPALDDKNLSNHCNKYLQHSVPTLTTDSVIGIKIRIPLSYGKECSSIKSFVVAVQCRVKRRNHKLSYYMTRGPEKNCVYSLKCTRIKGGFIFTIINKHCDFENNPLWPLKRKRQEIISQMNKKSGQPIAKDEYLLQYELEHQEMLGKEGKEDKFIEWPYAMAHPNLDSYCYQYMGECAPGRNREGVTGIWKTEKLYKLLYQKLHKLKLVEVTIVICVPPKPSKLRYYMTRAPDPNCVFALLLRGYNEPNYIRAHFEIIFKHCNFVVPNDHEISNIYDNPDENVFPKTGMKEEPLNEKITSHNCDICPYKNIFPKTEVKEEPLNTLELFFPTD